MRRRSVLSFALVVLLGVMLAGGTALAAQGGDSQASDLARHPLVGSWVLDTDTSDPANPPTLAVFSSDGVYMQTEADGTVGIGAWEATGDATAAMTFRIFFNDGTALVVRVGTIEVSADHNSLTATYTLEVVSPDGSMSGQAGPGHVTGTRLMVEPMGTPVTSIDALLGGTPEATPAG